MSEVAEVASSEVAIAPIQISKVTQDPPHRLVIQIRQNAGPQHLFADNGIPLATLQPGQKYEIFGNTPRELFFNYAKHAHHADVVEGVLPDLTLAPPMHPFKRILPDMEPLQKASDIMKWECPHCSRVTNFADPMGLARHLRNVHYSLYPELDRSPNAAMQPWYLVVTDPDTLEEWQAKANADEEKRQEKIRAISSTANSGGRIVKQAHRVGSDSIPAAEIVAPASAPAPTAPSTVPAAPVIIIPDEPITSTLKPSAYSATVSKIVTKIITAGEATKKSMGTELAAEGVDEADFDAAWDKLVDNGTLEKKGRWEYVLAKRPG